MEKIEILKGLLTTQMNHWIVYTIGITVLGVAGSEEMYIAPFMLLGVLPFVFYLIRHHTDKFLPFAGFHVLAIAVTAFLMLRFQGGNISPAPVFFLYIFGYTVLSIVVRIKKKDRLEGAMHPAAAMIIVVAMMLLQRYQGRAGLDSYYAISIIAYIGLYLICYYLKNFQRFISESDSAAGHVPERAIFKTGIKLVGLFTVIVVVLISLMPQFIPPPVSLPAMETEVPAEVTMDMYLPPGWDIPELPDEDGYSPRQLNRFWVYAGPAITIAILAGIAIFGIVMLVRFLRETFALTMERKKRSLELEVDVREKVDVEKAKIETMGVLSYFSPRERIRRIFKKRVLEGKDILVGDREPASLNMYTAQECRRALGDGVPASIYDKARYSDMECSVQDVKAAKKSLSH